MASRIETLTEIPESKLLELIKGFREDNADTVTAINDKKGTFSVEATFMQGAPGAMLTKVGPMSTFGGPDDTGVAPDEGLALYDSSNMAENPELFLAVQPPSTTGLARRLNPEAKYLACRWDYAATPKNFLRTITVKVSNRANGKSDNARPVDFGPNASTGRVVDLSPGLARALDLETNDTCSLEIPTPEVGVAVGVNLAEIDAEFFPSEMTRALVAMTTSNNMTYWVVNQIGAQEGGQSLMRRVGKDPPHILLSDTVILPVKANDLIPAAVADELNKAVQNEPAVPEGPPGAPPGPSEDPSGSWGMTPAAFRGQTVEISPVHGQ